MQLNRSSVYTRVRLDVLKDDATFCRDAAGADDKVHARMLDEGKHPEITFLHLVETGQLEKAFRYGWKFLPGQAPLSVLPSHCFEPRAGLASHQFLDQPDFRTLSSVRWRWKSGKHQGGRVLFSPLGLVLGTVNEENNGDYYDAVSPELHVLDPDTGLERVRLADRAPLTLHGTLFFCMCPRSRVLEARSLWDGTLQWEYPLDFQPEGMTASIHGLFCWPGSDDVYGKQGVWLLPWSSDSQAPTGPLQPISEIPAHGYPRTNVSSVRALGDRVAFATWQDEPVRTRLEVLTFPSRRSIWCLETHPYQDEELFLEEQGFILRTQKALEAYDCAGRLQWQGPGSSRIFLSSGPHGTRIVALREQVGPNPQALLEIRRDTGEVHRILEGSFWRVVLAGQICWCLQRPARTLEAVQLDGSVLYRGPQPEAEFLGPYGIDRLYPYAGRLFAVGDSGNVVCYEDAANEARYAVPALCAVGG